MFAVGHHRRDDFSQQYGKYNLNLLHHLT